MRAASEGVSDGEGDDKSARASERRRASVREGERASAGAARASES